MKPTLVILAAGLSRRYGRSKQIEAVGPDGVTIVDYSIYDALRAGFGKIVFVIRAGMEADFESAIGGRYRDRVASACAIQRDDALPGGATPPPGRTGPWGTAHAVLSAEACVDGPFAVVNADDFYGADAFVVLNDFLRQGTLDYAMIGYALRATLTPTGPVNRGCCACTPDGWLEHITEVAGLEAGGMDARGRDGSGSLRVIRGDTPVSMNAWAFTPAIFGQLRERFACFLRAHGSSLTAEFGLSGVVQELIQLGQARVAVLPTTDTWVGMTHANDRPGVVRHIAELIAAGTYPRELWS